MHYPKQNVCFGCFPSVLKQIKGQQKQSKDQPKQTKKQPKQTKEQPKQTGTGNFGLSPLRFLFTWLELRTGDRGMM
jgi:hypothetical protein